MLDQRRRPGLTPWQRKRDARRTRVARAQASRCANVPVPSARSVSSKAQLKHGHLNIFYGESLKTARIVLHGIGMLI